MTDERKQTPSGKPMGSKPRKRVRAGGGVEGVVNLLAELGLATVCEGAHCPNRNECFERGTATFMILGETCTRNCRFCAVGHGAAGPPREDEPRAVAQAAARLGLRHVVVTSVTRDDLADGGAGHFAATIRAIRAAVPEAAVEVLTPDFQGDAAAVATVVAAGPDVFNHNIETVPRLYGAVRPQADYGRSLGVLREAARVGREIGLRVHTKSGLMVGMGERKEEVWEVLGDLREAGCEIVTIGQYLAPSREHYGVVRYVEAEEFEEMAERARGMGFGAVASGAFVRSSYRAGEVFGGR